MIQNIEHRRERQENIPEKEAKEKEKKTEEQEEKQAENDVDLIVTENERTLKGNGKDLCNLGYQKQIQMVILIKSNHIYQSVNRGQAKGNAVYKCNHNAMGKIE